ncbi:flagellar biosynthetic protein FliR [Luminiphilus sp.]|nr:flagellar biosynthetic protein FliR [Luminiphilus sp.]MDB2666914.1 flagellar biosynthetic protein FliR [Luminiphilus sp.]
MPIALDTFLSSLYLFSAPFLRISAMMLVAPVFSAPGLSVRTRVLLATLVAALVAPSLPASNLPDMFSATGLLAAFQEVGVGLMIGFILQLAFGAIVFGAQAMSMTMGLGFAMAVDPQNGVQVPVVAQLYVILGTLLFLSLDGHLMLIAAVVESYRLVPAGINGISASALSGLVSLGSIVFAGGILLALPVMTALLLVNLAFGIITRTAPQLNIFAVGFPVTILGGLLIMFIVMPGFLDALRNLFDVSITRSLMIFN